MFVLCLVQIYGKRMSELSNVVYIVPFVTFDYEVTLGDEEYSLVYSRLTAKYKEELAVKRPEFSRLMYHQGIISENIFKVIDAFATSMTAKVPADSRRFKYYMTANALLALQNSELASFCGLATMVVNDGLPKEKLQGLLFKRLIRHLLNTFEVDILRATIGDFKTLDDLMLKKSLFVEKLRNRWKNAMPILEADDSKKDFFALPDIFIPR